MPYLPKHRRQLGEGVRVPGRARGSMDCGPCSWEVLADKQSAGRVKPGRVQLRKRANVSGPQPTNIDDAWRALNGYPVPGRTKLRYYRKRRVAQVRRAVRLGRPVQLAIAYFDWNKTQRRATGDPNFLGGHSVAIVAERRRGPGVEWLLYDSLDDRRRPGIPAGARWVLRRHVISAAVALAGGNRNGIWAGVMGGGKPR